MRRAAVLTILVLLTAAWPALAEDGSLLKNGIYDLGSLKPVDSVLKVKVGDPVPDFTLRSLAGELVGPGMYKGKKNLVISFIPGAWTPVCSDQWPGYNIAREIFEERDAVLLGITVDNLPTLSAWIGAMGGLWFPVLSDFWPHGQAAEMFGVLRSDGMSERALFVIDRDGVIRYIDVHDVNRRPDLGVLAGELDKLK